MSVKTCLSIPVAAFRIRGALLWGDETLVGHNVVFATLNHGFAPEDRGTTYPKPIRTGKKVWIGANATILPGVTIGDHAIVAAGAVVTKDRFRECDRRRRAGKVIALLRRR